MPDNQSRIHKINGQNGELIWSITINNTTGFGITEINAHFISISGQFEPRKMKKGKKALNLQLLSF